MNQQNSKTHVQQLLHKARTRQNCFPFGLIISQGHNSFECLFEAYSELWRKIKIEPNWIVSSPTTFMDKYLFQLFPMALENCNLKLREEEVMTLLLDSWINVWSNSILGLIHLFGYSESDILEIFDFSSERHTAEI